MQFYSCIARFEKQKKLVAQMLLKCSNPQDKELFQYIMQRKLAIKSYFTVYAIGITASLSSFVMGYSHVFLSQMSQVIQKKNDLSLQQIALTLTIVVSATNLGQVIGPFMYKSFSDRYGQARAMINCNLIIIASIAIQLIQLNIAYLIAGRVILGIAIGIMSSIVPLYLNSIAPLSISGKICSLNQIMTCFGVIAAYSLGFAIIENEGDDNTWRLLIGFPILPCLISITSLKFLYPFDRIQRHIEKKQEKMLEKFVKLVYKQASIKDISEEKTQSLGQLNTAEYHKELERYTIAMVTIASCQLCGINGIFYYTKQLFGQVTQGDTRLCQQLMVGLAICQVGASLICSRFVDYFGRKFLILRGQQTLIFILFVIFIVDNIQEELNLKMLRYLIIGLLYIHVIAFNFSLGPVAIIYAAELVPNLTPIIVTLRAATFLVALSTNYIIHEFGIGQLFLMFGVLSAVAHTYLNRHLRQTKGKSKPQIYHMFQLDSHQDFEEKTTLV